MMKYSKQLKILAIVVPVLMAIATYANIYFSSFFNGVENFSWFVLFTQMLNYFIMWLIAQKVIAFYAKKDQVDWKLFTLLVIGLAIFKVLIYMAKKQYMIITYPQNDSIGILHIATDLSMGVLIAFIIVAIQYFLYYQYKWTEETLRSVNLAKENSKAQLNALQTQVNPHFLFNNLNTLQSLIEPDNQNAQDFLVELSELYRYLLSKNQEEIVSLEEEVEVGKKFNFLIRQRYGTNFQCRFDIGKEQIGRKHLPPFSIQMLLENVVKHNRIDDEHQVKCEVYLEGDFLVVKNNLEPKSSSYASNKIGLSNLRKRYELLSQKSIQIDETETEFKVKIPLLKVKEL